MNALATIFVVSATILSAVRLARCQADRVDNKYLDPNDYFLAGGDLQDRRRILQDAFNRYTVQQQQENQQPRTGFDGIFQQRQQQQTQQQQGFQRSGRKFTTDEPEQNFETSGRFTSRSDPRVSPIPTPSIQQGPLTLSNSNIRQLLQQLDVAGSQQCNLNVQAQWDFETNVNEGTQIRALEQQLLYSEFQRKVFSIMTRLNLDNVIDPNLRRQLKFLSMPGPAALPQEQLSRYNRLINDMLAVYNSASVCAFDEPLKCGLRLDPDLNMIMSRSRDWNELQHTWIEWRRRTGQKVRDMFEQLVDVSNQAALLNNVSDASEMWKFPYESPSMRFELEDAWEQIKPLYEQLHAYVRKKLRDLYGPERISREAPLPAHVLGNMWGQSWENILDLTIPYPGKKLFGCHTTNDQTGIHTSCNV
jgi:peptidyl-dipeptidase A